MNNNFKEDSIYDLPTGKLPMDSSANSVIENQAEITGLYKFLFESDLNSAKQKTLMLLEDVKGKKDELVEEKEVMMAENEMLKNIIKRY